MKCWVGGVIEVVMISLERVVRCWLSCVILHHAAMSSYIYFDQLFGPEAFEDVHEIDLLLWRLHLVVGARINALTPWGQPV